MFDFIKICVEWFCLEFIEVKESSMKFYLLLVFEGVEVG